MFLRAKKIKGKTYFCVVEGRRDFEGKVQQETLHYLGEPRSALVKAQELRLPQRMIQKIQNAIQEKERYMVVKVTPEGNFSASPWFCSMTQDEFRQFLEKFEE